MISNLPDTGCYPVPGGWAGLGPTLRLGVVDTAWPGALCWTLLKCLPSLTFWLGSGLRMASRPQGICRQGSASLVFSWCWGSQLKAPSWQCSFLAPKHPQQCAVDPEGMSLDRVFVWCFRGKRPDTQGLLCLLRHIPLSFTAQEANFP